MNEERDTILGQFYQADYFLSRGLVEAQEISNDINFLRQNGYLEETSNGDYLLTAKGINHVEAQSLVQDDIMRDHKKIRNGLKYAHEKLQEDDSQFEQNWRKQMVFEGIDEETITAIQDAMTLNGML